jgi:hypothetical protein
VAPADCVFCGAKINGGDAAVGVCVGVEDPTYAPFLEDMTEEFTWLMHAGCYGREHSMDSLLDVIHEHDVRVRSVSRTLRGPTAAPPQEAHANPARD